MVGEIGTILRELERVQDRLASLTNDAHAEKYALMARQEELQTRAARLAEDVDAECSTQRLLTQLAHLRYRRDMLVRQRHSRPELSQSHVGGGAQVDVRIERIRSLLADRGIRVH
jgi:hypothetical protein